MEKFIIGIAGGSGCGKSTLAYGLKDRFPGLIEVMHFDDYQKEERDVPMYEGMRNWDHPDAIDFDALYSDLKKIISGEQVEVMTKSSILNPTYEEKGRIKHTLAPQNVIILEGYMALLNERIRDLLDLKIYLDLPMKEGMRRRTKITHNDEDVYNQKILAPMHKRYVGPTQQFADMVIDTTEYDASQVQEVVINKLHELGVL